MRPAVTIPFGSHEHHTGEHGFNKTIDPHFCSLACVRLHSLQGNKKNLKKYLTKAMVEYLRPSQPMSRNRTSSRYMLQIILRSLFHEL